MSLYALTNDLINLEAMLTDEECEVSKECLLDTLDALEGDYSDKINSYCKIIKNLKKEEDALGEEIKRLQARKKSRERAIDRLKDALASSMDIVGKEKVKTGMFTVYGVKHDKLDITGAVPDEYKVEYVTKKNNENAIKQALAEGEVLSFARLINSVTIR